MKFTEAKLEQVSTELLENEGYTHFVGSSLVRTALMSLILVTFPFLADSSAANTFLTNSGLYPFSSIFSNGIIKKDFPCAIFTITFFCPAIQGFMSSQVLHWQDF